METARYAMIGDDGVAPHVTRGAFAIVDMRHERPRSGAIYLVDAGDELLARRLHRLPGGGLQLLADTQPQWRWDVPDGATALRRIVWAGQSL